MAYDEASGSFDKKKGDPLFDDGGSPTKFLQEQIDFLRLFHAESKRTQEFLEVLKKEDLLIPYNVDIVRGADHARFAIRATGGGNALEESMSRDRRKYRWNPAPAHGM